jgi:hypothetical protein
MEENGMKKIDVAIKTDPKVKISLKILPFGSISYEASGLEGPQMGKKHKMPIYIEPLTTNIEKAEILYEDNELYLVPKTTAGM